MCVTRSCFLADTSYSGIGYEASVLFAKEGAQVVCADLNEQGIQKTVAKITEMVGQDRAIAVKVDVSKEDQVKHLVDTAVKTFGKLNIMFNNAGIMHPEDDNALTTQERIWYVSYKHAFSSCTLTFMLGI